MLEHALPAGGTWSGEGVSGDLFTPSMAGEFVLTYSLLDTTTGVTVSAQQVLVTVEPQVTMISGSGADCDTGPVVYHGEPANGYWGGIADVNGVIDRSCTARPNYGAAQYSYAAVNGTCHAQGEIFDLLECTVVDLGADLQMCSSGGDLTIDHYMPAFGGGNLTGFDEVIFTGDVSGPILTGFFHAGKPPGEYLVYGYSDAPGSCSGSDTLMITVFDPPQIEVVEGNASDLCDTLSLVLDASPAGGYWSGLADGQGVVDRSCTARPFDLFARYSIEMDNGVCAAQLDLVGLECPGYLDLGPDLQMCNMGDELIIPLYIPTFGGGDLLGFDLVTFNDGSISGHFHVGKPPGEYLVHGYITMPGSCDAVDTVMITVYDPPEVTIVEGGAPNSCDTVPLVLAASPPGGSWSGLADENGVVDRSCDQRPFEGPAVYSIEMDNGECHSLFFVTGQFCMPVNLGPDTTLCSESAPIVAYLSNAQMAGPGYLQGFDSLQIDPTTAVGIFHPSLHEPGSYLLWGTAGGPNVCPGFDTMIVTIAPAATVFHGITVDAMLINDEPIELSGGIPANGYYSNAEGEVITVFDPSMYGIGVHAIIYTAADEMTGCLGTDTSYIQVDVMSAVEIAAFDGTQVHPNPARDELIVSCGPDRRLVLFDLFGKQAGEWRTTSVRTDLDISGIAAGIYLLRIEGDDRSSQHMIQIQ